MPTDFERKLNQEAWESKLKDTEKYWRKAISEELLSIGPTPGRAITIGEAAQFVQGIKN